MPPRPNIVLADDLTGAAEIAAIARQSGRRAIVLTRPPAGPVDADLLVLDTDTRLLPPALAARRVRAWTTLLARNIPRHAGVFLKTDSVIRGPVLAQIAAAARALGRSRTLLVPANPSLGRVIRGGRYFIHGRFLHETAFASDPHHPRNTSDALALLGRARGTPRVCLPADSTELPARGVILGEAANSGDIRRWRRHLDSDTLPAGGADFFRAWLGVRASGQPRLPARPPRLPAPALLLHGSTASPADTDALFFSGIRAPSLSAVSKRLARRGAAFVAAPFRRLQGADSAAALSVAFAKLSSNLKHARAFQHLLIAGGATASAVLSALDWTALEVVHVWGPGTVTLRSLAEPDFFLTLKPGSYPWPDELRRALPAKLLS